MDKYGAKEGHLVIFDKRDNIPWEEKIFHRVEDFEGHKIIVWGMLEGNAYKRGDRDLSSYC